MPATSRLPELIERHEDEILNEWVKAQLAAVKSRRDVMSESDMRRDSTEFIRTFGEAAQRGDLADIAGAPWEKMRGVLKGLSDSRIRLGFSPAETATFVFSLKRPLFALVMKELESDPKAVIAELWAVTEVLDALGLFTAEVHMKAREEIIRRQQAEMLELSTPVVKLWDQMLALPLVGTLDSARTQVVMETLLQEIVNTGSRVAIIDITGVPTVDTLVAQHLMKTVAAARLMGAECIISGIRPQIALAMVHLGVTFTDIVTKATLADAIRHGFAITGYSVGRAAATA
jgi:rsbT co-antagonist protein RsbR